MVSSHHYDEDEGMVSDVAAPSCCVSPRFGDDHHGGSCQSCYWNIACGMIRMVLDGHSSKVLQAF